MKNTRTRRLLLCSVALVAAITASACSSDGTTDAGGVASLDNTGSDNTGSDNTDSDSAAESGSEADGADELEAPDDPDEALRLYSQCMSDAGFDDGLVETDGEFLSVEPADGDDIDPQAELGESDLKDFEEAIDRCDQHLAKIDQGFEMSPEEEAALRDAELAFNKCMTDEGFDDSLFFGESDATADPQADSLDDIDDDALDAAFEKCASALESTLGTEGSDQ